MRPSKLPYTAWRLRSYVEEQQHDSGPPCRQIYYVPLDLDAYGRMAVATIGGGCGSRGEPRGGPGSWPSGPVEPMMTDCARGTADDEIRDQMPELPLSAEEINPDGRRPWTVNDGELARQIWQELKPDAQEFLGVLMEDVQRRLTLREIAQRMRSRPEYLNQRILGQAGTLCRKHGMQRLWRYPPQPYRLAVYWMDEVVAGLLRNVEYADEPADQR